MSHLHVQHFAGEDSHVTNIKVITDEQCLRETKTIEAQPSKRYRAMLCVIEYFAKSLKITQGHSK